MINQFLRSETSIGANIREAFYAHGKADFIAKLQIALKECSETEYWIELILESGYYYDKTLLDKCTEIKRILGSEIEQNKCIEILENYVSSEEVIDSLVMAFLYEFSSVVTRYVTINPPDFSSAENLFREFIELLSSESPKKRFVKYYAEKLNVTPKYLSSVCKSISGHTALDLINQYVVKDILYALKKKESSIKDIAYGLDFPNLSFFGKYVKKHLGMSPRMYREKMYKDDE